MKTKLAIPTIAFLGAIAQLASGHAELSGSNPAADAVLGKAPKEIMLHFSEPVRLTALSVQKQADSKQSLGPLPRSASEHFSVAAPELSDGQYTVTWRALSEDTHVMTGEFAFAVGAGSAPAQPAEPQDHAHSAHSEPQPSRP
jgi:methionine-rich copper-binding protein CopC